MATITPKQTHRNRIQFTMPRQLYEAHQTNLELAAELNVIIDFSRDFNRWFFTQVEQAAKLLKQMEVENSSPESQVELTEACASSNTANHSPESETVAADETSPEHEAEVTDGRD